MAVPIEALVGKQDSHLSSLGVDLTDAERDALRESYSELRQRWGVDNREVWSRVVQLSSSFTLLIGGYLRSARQGYSDRHSVYDF